MLNCSESLAAVYKTFPADSPQTPGRRAVGWCLITMSSWTCATKPWRSRIYYRIHCCPTPTPPYKYGGLQPWNWQQLKSPPLRILGAGLRTLKEPEWMDSPAICLYKKITSFRTGIIGLQQKTQAQSYEYIAVIYLALESTTHINVDNREERGNGYILWLKTFYLTLKTFI